jgi:histidinol phosphatase-like enzyme
MIVRAAREHGVDLAGSWMIGDILNDVEAGNRAGCRTVLIDNGNETEWVAGEGRSPHLVARTVLEAALRITSDSLETIPDP